jgi:hypothetical protein
MPLTPEHKLQIDVVKLAHEVIEAPHRLPPELWAAIDGARDKRPGNVSRNTWVVEAITEKLAKEQQNAAESDRPHV